MGSIPTTSTNLTPCNIKSCVFGPGRFFLNPYSPHTYDRFGPQKNFDFLQKTNSLRLTLGVDCVTVYNMRTTTVYPKSVKDPNGTLDVLKKGSNNKKLGFKVTAKKWTGKRLYSLTLTERDTCPTSCHHWDDCYGNNMPFAHRFAVGDDSTGWTDLELRLKEEVAMLMRRHPQGIVIRLHVLGDFYSVNYVHVWEGLLLQYPELCVFGYTGRELSDPIGKAIHYLNQASHGRFVIRYSRSKEYDGTNLYAAEESFTGESFTCPEQTGALPSCADCGACWIANKTVRFLSH